MIKSRYSQDFNRGKTLRFFKSRLILGAVRESRGSIYMSMLHTTLLSIVQGVTEFLPISSSAHLRILSLDLSLTQTVAFHTGTFLAVLLYFWRDFKNLVMGGIDIVLFRKSHRAQFCAKIICATLPLFFAILVFRDFIEVLIMEQMILFIIGITSIVFGILLWVIDRIMPENNYVEDINYVGAFFLGVMQVLALVPGISRSGICITGGRMLGLKRTQSGRMALLMGMPTLLGISLVAGMEWYESVQGLDLYAIEWQTLYGMVLSFLTAIFVIHFMMRWFRRFDTGIFVIYRILFGMLVLYIYYSVAGV